MAEKRQKLIAKELKWVKRGAKADTITFISSNYALCSTN